MRKTHARKGLRPVSQTGLHRIPHNPNQRVAGEGGRKVSGTALGAFNDSQGTQWLHPTKGWRHLNEKRTQAALTVAEILHHDPLPRSLTAGRSKYMPHIGKKQLAKAEAAA